MKLPDNILVHGIAEIPPNLEVAGKKKLSRGVSGRSTGNKPTGSKKTATARSAEHKARNSISKGRSPVFHKNTATESSNPVTVGVWDMGDWLGYLPMWLETLNKGQEKYQFFTIEAMVPLGMVRKPEGVVAWAEVILERKLTKSERTGMEKHTIAEEFFELAERVRKEVSDPTTKKGRELDYLVGVTPAMVAGIESQGVYFNHFSTFSGRTALASTFDLRRYASESEAPFSAFVIGVMVAQLLVAQFYDPKNDRTLGFHPEIRGCLFDYCGDRESLKEKIEKLSIEPECLDLIPAGYQKSAQDLVKVIRRLK